MKLLTAILVFMALGNTTAFASEDTRPFAIAVHGGAGTMSRAAMTPERERAYHAALRTALQAGHAVLADGGTSLDAVVAAVRILEDNPLFNAGRGAVFTAEGRNELDAAIMDGATLNAGAIAAVTRVRNPILLARAVMEHSPHVFLIGEGAEAFAAEREIPFVDPRWFHTDERWEALERARAAEISRAAHEIPYGTVGAVALDRSGNLAAATSTGGMTNKRWGRVGDVPVIGAGTYADNASAAVSATGHGEYFIRSVVAHEIAARMRLAGRTLEQAAHEVVMEVLVERGGSGGVIAVDRHGNVSMPFNSDGMYRGYMKSGGEPVTAIFRD
ncbi:MAG: isoaspartyl peptidase/L-asparaginase [Xanthomonadaceae bacterium]|nr:isoaspartyl peptidase/L-asparaginase [Xanthomonadaceae bacterium]